MPNPIPKKDAPYLNYNLVEFPNVVSPNAQGHPTPIPLTTFGITLPPQFNKATAAKLPSAAMVIRGLIRGNTAT